MVFRKVEDTDWPQIIEIFKEEGQKAPDKSTMTGAVCEQNGEIIAFRGVEVMIHAGPLWVRKDYRGKGIWRGLSEVINKWFTKGTGYYVFSSSPKTDAINRKLGLEDLKLKVFKKEF